MKRETVKALLANGVLQAYAEGKEIEFAGLDGEWGRLSSFANFSEPPIRYRIKPIPQFKLHDLVRVHGEDIGEIVAISEEPVQYYIQLKNRTHIWASSDIVHVREVRLPLTFEQAVKLLAEKGFTLTNGARSFDVLCLGKLVITWLCRETGETSTERYECFCNSLTFPDNTPFANVTYEDIT